MIPDPEHSFDRKGSLDHFDSEALSEAIAKLTSAWHAQSAEQARLLATIDLTAEFREAIVRLAQRGWTLPMSLTYRDIDDLLKTSDEETDTFFETYYTEDHFKELRKVSDELSNRHSLTKWRSLLSECFESFEAGRHLIVVPALLSVLDGVISSAGASNRKQRPLKICYEKAREPNGSMSAMMWISMWTFVKSLFQSASFDEDRPATLNRHWILHGRDVAAWTRADALRLFNALQTVDSLLEPQR